MILCTIIRLCVSDVLAIEKMGPYAKAFNPTFYGVRMEGEALEAAKATFEIDAAKSETQTGNPDSYGSVQK